MGRVTLSVPDEMQARIQSNQDGLNFSLLAREAFANEFLKKDATKLGEPEETIERLREDRRMAKESRKKEMRIRAKIFVRDYASFHQLKVLETASFENSKNMEDQLTDLFFDVDDDPKQYYEWREQVLGSGGVANSDVLEFLLAVGEIWAGIKERVEADDVVS